MREPTDAEVADWEDRQVAQQAHGGNDHKASRECAECRAVFEPATEPSEALGDALGRVTDLFEEWAAEQEEHTRAGEYGIAEGLNVAIDGLREAVHSLDWDGSDPATSVFGVPMTAADQPTTEPSEGTDWQETAQVLARAIRTGDMSEVQERLDALAPAPQPAADQQCTACDGRGDEGSTYMNSGKCQTCHGTGTQPAADTETEVQWGVRERPLVHGVTLLSTEDDARGLARRDHGVVVTRTVAMTTTRWEEA